MRLSSKIGTKSNIGQTIIEYAIVASIVTIAVVTMSTYVFRATQSTQQMILDEFREN